MAAIYLFLESEWIRFYQNGSVNSQVGKGICRMDTTTKMIYGLDRSKYPARMGKAWTWDEDTKLLESIKNGKELADIAKEHERTEGGIWCHLCVIAHNMYNENRPIGEITVITGLSEHEILDRIKKIEIKDEKRKERKEARKEEKSARKKLEKKSEDPSHSTECVSKLEIMNLINDIQTKMTRLNILVAMMS